MAEIPENIHDVIPPEFSDEALAIKFAQENSHCARYVAAWGKWMLWDGKCWKIDDTLKAFDLSRSICRAASVQFLGNDNTAKRLASAQTVAAVERLVKADRRMAATADQWDADLWALNTPDGIVDLHTGAIRKTLPVDYSTKITAVSPGGDCPTWFRFLQKITDGNTELMDYLRRKSGYCLTGSTREQDLEFLYGTGGNGKGVFLNTLTGIMNTYATVANIETFTASPIDRHPTDLAVLRGARLVVAQETEEGRQWAESRIKTLTGGDPITARFMRQDFFTFIPQFKLMLAGNHKPGLRNVDEAIRRRFHLVPFTVKIPENERDDRLAEKLKAEWPGILKWMIQGAVEWQQNGLNSPAAVREATTEYLTEEDTIEQWINTCCTLNKWDASSTSELFKSWRKWCEESGERFGSMKGFYQNLRSKHPEFGDWQCPMTRRRGVKGIQLLSQ